MNLEEQGHCLSFYKFPKLSVVHGKELFLEL
jgi:hypothetical protein